MCRSRAVLWLSVCPRCMFVLPCGQRTALTGNGIRAKCLAMHACGSALTHRFLNLALTSMYSDKMDAARESDTDGVLGAYSTQHVASLVCVM